MYSLRIVFCLVLFHAKFSLFRSLIAFPVQRRIIPDRLFYARWNGWFQKILHLLYWKILILLFWKISFFLWHLSSRYLIFGNELWGWLWSPTWNVEYYSFQSFLSIFSPYQNFWDLRVRFTVCRLRTCSNSNFLNALSKLLVPDANKIFFQLHLSRFKRNEMNLNVPEFLFLPW